MDDKVLPNRTLEDIFSTIEFGWPHVFIILILGSVQFFYATQINLLAFLGPILICEWKIDLWDSSMISMAVFIGMVLGSPIFGKMSDIYGRKVVVFTTACGIFYFSLLGASGSTVYWIILNKFIIGIFTGGFSTLFYTFLTETMTNSQRGTSIMCLQIFWSMGFYFVSLLERALVPDFGWRIWTIVTISPMIIAIPCVLWLPESPRYLVTHNRLKEAQKVIEKLAKTKNILLISEIKEETVLKRTAFKDIFHPNYALTSCISAYVCFISGLSYYGFVFSSSVVNDIPHKCLQDWETISVSPMFPNGLSDNSCCLKQSWHRMETVLISITGELLSYISAMLIINLISRKFFLRILLMINAIDYCLLNLCLSPRHTGLLMMFGRGSAGILLRINLLYVSEVFPTSIRCFILGLGNSLARLGGMFASVLVNMIMVKTSYLIFTILYSVINLLGFLLIFCLPYETRNRELTQNVNDDMSNFKKK